MLYKMCQLLGCQPLIRTRMDSPYSIDNRGGDIDQDYSRNGRMFHRKMCTITSKIFGFNLQQLLEHLNTEKQNS